MHCVIDSNYLNMLVIPDTICQSLLERPQVTRSCWYSAAVRGYCHHCHHCHRCHWRLNTGRCRISHCSSLPELSTNIREVSKGSPAKWAFKQNKYCYWDADAKIITITFLIFASEKNFFIKRILLIFKRLTGLCRRDGNLYGSFLQILLWFKHPLSMA